MNQPRRKFLTHLPFAAALPASAALAAPPAPLAQRLLAAVNDIRLFNTHEHTMPEDERVRTPLDFFDLAQHYAINDVISAGLPPEAQKIVRDKQASLPERWRAFEPYWRYAKFTGYGQALRWAVREIYDVEQIAESSLPTLNDRIREQNKPGIYRRVLIERAKIRYSVLDDYWNPAPVKPDPEFFVYARKFDRFVTPAGPDDVQALEKITGVSITSLDGLKQAMETSFEQSLEAGMVTVKSTLAYNREILYHETSEADARRDFEALMAAERPLPEGFRGRVERPFRRLEDYMFHHLIGLAAATNTPVQIHTGLHAGNGNFITNSNPTHLTNLFFLYPQVQFDLFHISYPYQGELAVLAKLFPNVYADFCWAHIISGSASRRTLHEMLETVPVNKIFGYGGDYRFVELSYAHAQMARRNIAQVLAEKVESGFATEDEALEIARLLLHDNPARLFSPR